MPQLHIYLADWRKDRGWTQQRLADQLGMTKASISRIENGLQGVNDEFLEAVALALNTTPSDLIRRRPSDPEGIDVTGLRPEQVEAVKNIVEQFRRTGTTG